jgi:sugar phosphate isomerase/epimerase
VGLSASEVAARVQVNIPFPFLFRGYLDKFLKGGLNPEIGLDAWSLDTYRPRDFRRVARAFAAAGRRVTLHGPFQDLLPGALDDIILAAARRRLREACRWLPVFRPETLVCHLGYESRHYRWEREAWLTRVSATYREVGRAAGASGAALMLENVYEDDPELLKEVISRINLPNVRVCLDVGHLQAFGGGDFAGWLAALWPLIGQLHLHDNRGAGDDHQALGTGTVPLDYVLTFLAQRGRRPLVTLEPHQEGSLSPSLEYLATTWPWE